MLRGQTYDQVGPVHELAVELERAMVVDRHAQLCHHAPAVDGGGSAVPGVCAGGPGNDVQTAPNGLITQESLGHRTAAHVSRAHEENVHPCPKRESSIGGWHRCSQSNNSRRWPASASRIS